MNKPIISACIITFQHETYIRSCIEGALMQNFNGSYEIVIGEDCSTDETRNICKEYAAKYPNKIRLILNSKNLGMIENWINTLNACNGKYIAVCEGDDYWTDPYKMQIQVDFLENHPEVSLCFTNSRVLYDETNEFSNWPIPLANKYYTATEIMFDLVVPTCSVVFRNMINNDITSRLLNKNYLVGDLILWLSLAEFGKLYCLNEQMVVYRRNQSSVAYKLPLEKQILLIKQHEHIAIDFQGKYLLIEKKFLSRQYLVIGLKCLFSHDKRSIIFLKKAFSLNPRQIPHNIFYLVKRLFIKDRSI